MFTTINFDNDINISMHPNSYLKNKEDFFKMVSILGIENIRKQLEDCYHILNDDNIINFFNNSDIDFYQDENKKYLLSTNSDIWEHRLGNLNSIKVMDALKKYGIDLLDEAVEKCIAVIT